MAYFEYTPTRTIYHYCPCSAFMGILSSKKLWFSDLTKANDPREIQLGHGHMLDAIKYVRHNDYHGDQGIFLSILYARLKLAMDVGQLFCCCFSLKGDELPMWREYADNGKGVSIGFRPTAIAAIPARVQKVKYVDEHIQEDFRNVVRFIADRMPQLYHDDDDDDDDALFWVDSTVEIYCSITSLKHYSWRHEEEVRIVHLQHRHDGEIGNDFDMTAVMPDGRAVLRTKPLERMRGENKIEYMEFEFGKYSNEQFDHSRAISIVILGPKCDLDRNAVRKALEKAGFVDFEVRSSSCEIS